MGQRWAKALFVCYSTDGGEYWVEQYYGRYRWVGPVTTDTIFWAPTLERARSGYAQLDPHVKAWRERQRREGAR